MKRLALVIACLAIGCGGEPAPASTPDAGVQAEPTPADAPPEPTLDPAEQQAAQAQTLVETLEALAVIHERDADDCPTLASSIAAFHGEHGATLATAAPELHATIDGDPALATRTRAAMESVMSASMRCRADPDFAATQAKLFGADG